MSNILKGKALWAKVFEPNTRWDAAGVYEITVHVPETEAQEMCEHLDSLIEEQRKEEIKAKPKATLSTRKPYAKATDQDGNETGDIEFKLKEKSQITTRDGKTFKLKPPLVVDSKRTPMTKDTLIGNGSIVKVAVELKPYCVQSTLGVTMRLKGVQVLQLVEFSNASAMFNEEEGFITQAIEQGMDFEESHADF